VAEHLLSKCEALSSNPSTIKKKKKNYYGKKDQLEASRSPAPYQNIKLKVNSELNIVMKNLRDTVLVVPIL
jgi:hypothetical protein